MPLWGAKLKNATVKGSGGVVEKDTRYWLRPGKTYTAGRQTAGYDFYLTHKRHSRKEPHFSLKAGTVEPRSTLITSQEHGKRQPAYELHLTTDTKPVWITEQGKEDLTEVRTGTSFLIEDGMVVQLAPSADNHDSIHFEWRPVHIYYGRARNTDFASMQLQFAQLGITFSKDTQEPSQDSLPNTSHTHYVVPSIKREATFRQLMAGNFQLLLITSAWIQTLSQVAKAEGGERSKLEEDFLSNWPSEIDYFPPVEGQDSNSVENLVWQPNLERRDLFHPCIFLDFSDDLNMVHLVVSAGGVQTIPSLASAQAFLRDLQDFQSKCGVEKGGPVYVITQLEGKFNNEADGPMLHEVAEKAGITDFLDVRDIMSAITKVQRLAGSDPPARTNVDIGLTQNDFPIPTPSGPSATADISFPATFPNDLPAEPDRLPSVPQSSIISTSETRFSKKPRRIADRTPVDPFADMFGDSESYQKEAMSLPKDEIDIPAGNNLENNENAGISGSVSFQSLPRTHSKYAKLKRRAGQTQGPDSSQPFLIEDNKKQDAEMEIPPAKKFKSFDPNVESVTSHASQRKKDQQLVQLSNLPEEEEYTSKARQITLKRKGAALPQSSDKEPVQKAVRSTGRKDASQSLDTGTQKKGKQQLEEAELDQEAVQARYLHVDTGRRKVNTIDAGFNDDFNKLKIVKAVLPESHKMGWNERDIIQEEMNENTAWEPDDNATFFQIRYVSLARPERPIHKALAPIDPRYTDKPNYKAFRPKNGKYLDQAGTRKDRPSIELIVHEPPDYGLKESYGRSGDHDNDDASVEIAPTSSSRNARRGKHETGPKQAMQSSNTGYKRNVVISESEEEEGNAEAASTSRGSTAEPTLKRQRQAKESITLDDSSSEEGAGRTFAGFNRNSSTRRRVR